MLFKILLALHIAGGTTGLLVGSVVIARRKGDRVHRRLGQLFAGSMGLAGLTSLVMAVLHPNTFLFIVGVFTLYLVGTGVRYNRLRGLLSKQRPAAVDYLLTGAMTVFGLAFVVYGIQLLIAGASMGTVLLVFGFVGLSGVWQDVTNYRGRARSPKYWLLAHISRMMGAYIASLTAFLAVNAAWFPDAIPGAVIWLVPTAILTPLIVKWSREQRRSKDNRFRTIDNG